MRTTMTSLTSALACAIVLATSSTAAADRIDYGRGATSAPGAVVDFPNVGSISMTIGASTRNCPLRLIGDFGQKLLLRNGLVTIGYITGMNPNPILGGQPCSANTELFIGFPWLVAVRNPLPADGSINVSILGVTSEIVGTPCVFTGNITAHINGSAFSNPSGGLSSPLCGPATVGGTGATFTPGARLIV